MLVLAAQSHLVVMSAGPCCPPELTPCLSEAFEVVVSESEESVS